MSFPSSYPCQPSSLRVIAILALAAAGLLAQSPAAAQGVVPPSYDLRSAGPGGVSWVPAVQDQSLLNDCWTFATTTALDSNLIRNGYLPTSTTAPPIAVSSWHLSAYNGAPQWTTYDPGQNNYTGIVGGDNWMTTSYYTRGQGAWTIPGAKTGPNRISTMGGGPVLNASNSLNPFPLGPVGQESNLAPYLPPVSQLPGFTVTGAYYYDQQGSTRTDGEQVAAVKSALLQHGALATYMYAGGYRLDHHKESVFQYSSSLGYEYAYDPSPKASDHVVTIIGWDDTIVIPQGSGSTTGAWLVQNSWGAWGGTLQRHDGTFYAGYNDPYIGKQGVTAFTAVPAGTYSPIVLQNELGPTYVTGNWDATGSRNPDGDIPTGMGIIDSNRSSQAICMLTAGSDGILRGLGLTSVDAQMGAPTDVTVTIYSGIDIVDGQAVLGTALASGTFSFEQQGYTLFDLSTPLGVTQGQTLAILLDYQGSSLPYVWQSAALDGVDPPTGLTYFYDNNESQWVDFATFHGTAGQNDAYHGIFSVKGLMAFSAPTAVPEIDPAGLGSVLALAAGALCMIEQRRLRRRARPARRSSPDRIEMPEAHMMERIQTEELACGSW